MPFLRAALLKKKARQEPEAEPPVIVRGPEDEKLLEPVVVEQEETLQPAIAEQEESVQPVVTEQEESLPSVVSELEPEQEETVQPPVVVVVEEPEPEEPELEPEESDTLESLSRLMDEKEEQAQEDETVDEDSGMGEDAAGLEVGTSDSEDIHVPKDSSDGDSVSEVQTEEETGVQEPEVEQEPIPEPEDFKLKYDFTSGERYVDSVSTKTEFDKMLDELSAISGDLLSHEVEKFAVKFTGKFQGDFDKAESDAKKYEAFLGGYITNAAMILYDNGYRDAAIKRLEQAKSILEARKKLEDETLAIKTRVEEDNDTVDLSDILGLFGDG